VICADSFFYILPMNRFPLLSSLLWNIRYKTLNLFFVLQVRRASTHALISQRSLYLARATRSMQNALRPHNLFPGISNPILRVVSPHSLKLENSSSLRHAWNLPLTIVDLLVQWPGVQCLRLLIWRLHCSLSNFREFGSEPFRLPTWDLGRQRWAVMGTRLVYLMLVRIKLRRGGVHSLNGRIWRRVIIFHDISYL
jgi:hypothetical protein